MCKIKVDGAWKNNVRKDCPSAGIGWSRMLEDDQEVKGNDWVKATQLYNVKV